ncbi:MAG: TetR/AcrR family transcriptional regulator [Alphaproteobacteria bacterium]|nr:TetR/AcrR family transcriptional regulator [Alphaproteobacteria bacterium]
MVRKCKEDAEKTRQAVLESALDVFTEKGYARTTFDEIAARAGFTKGAVYWYFKNKADLVAALIVEYTQRKQAEIEKSLPKGHTLDDLIHFFEVWASVSKNDLRYAKFNRFVLCQMEWSEAVVDRVDKNLIVLKNFYLEKINRTLVECQKNGELKDGLDIQKIQHVITASYLGIMFSSLSKRFNFDAEEMVRLGLGLLINGIRK